MFDRLRFGPHDRHFAFEYIDKLWKRVDSGKAKYFPKLCRAAGVFVSRGGSKFVDKEGATPRADSAPSNEYGTNISELDRNHRQDQ